MTTSLSDDVVDRMKAVLARESQLMQLCHSDEIVGRVIATLETQPDGMLIDPETGEVLFDEKWDVMSW